MNVLQYHGTEPGEEEALQEVPRAQPQVFQFLLSSCAAANPNPNFGILVLNLNTHVPSVPKISEGEDEDEIMIAYKKRRISIES